MSVFYSHSTKNNQSYEIFLKISEKLKNTIMDRISQMNKIQDDALELFSKKKY
jgi:flagellar motor switch protein FliG